MSRVQDEPALARLFAEAMAAPAGERTDRARALCEDDPELLEPLLSLVRASTSSSRWLDGLAERVLPTAHAELGVIGQGLAPGSRIGPWEIAGVAGTGGMGVVYKARDLELERWVALKILPGYQCDGTRTVLAEARAASALDHPNVGVIYQVGTTDATSPVPGRPFIAAAFYEGRTVREWLTEGALPAEQAVAWTLQIAGALANAHAAGVVHGDIKAENVMVTPRGELKVLDFGVATVRGQRGGTAPAGTPSVMSPEQTWGEPLDGRTDLWSLGVLLFELLTGRRPFTGRDVDDVFRAIRDDDPPNPEDLVPGLPAAVTDVVRRCLAKDPSERYADADHVLADLRIAHSVLRGAAGKRQGSARGVVVRPFVNISPDPDTDYFADGLTEEMIHRLSGIRGLRVISRASVMRLRGRSDPADELAQELGVRYVVEGAVRRAGDRVRVTAHLLDSMTGAHVWVQRFDGALDDVFSIQGKVAQGVLDRLAVEPSPRQRRSLSEHPITHPGAYDAFLRARHEAWRFSEEGLGRARRYIDTALDIVGDNALLYSTLGHILAMAHEAGIEPGPRTLARVDELARRVGELDPEEPRGHWLRAFVSFQRGDLAAAIDAAERAHDGDPGDPDTLVLLGYIYAHVSRNHEARRLFLQAVDIDPLTPLTRCMPGMADLMDGRYAGAESAYRKTLEMDPDSPFAAFMYGWVLAQAGRTDDAVRELGRTAERFPATVFGTLAASLAAGLEGRTDEARDLLPPLAPVGERSEMFARLLCHAHTQAGELHEGLAWLERAIDLGMLNRPFLQTHDRLIAPLRGEPRFADLMAEVDARLAAIFPDGAASRGPVATA